MKIYCCACEKEVKAKLVSGAEVYAHRTDLKKLPFWQCEMCKNFVGCHYKTKNRTRPLGVIATKEIKNARQHIHKILDPLWKEKGVPRGKIYAILSEKLGREYHTAEIRSIEEARSVYTILKKEFYRAH